MDRPAWRSRVWTAALVVLGVIGLLLATTGFDGPDAGPVALAVAVTVTASVVAWAIARTRSQRRRYDEDLATWAAERAARDERLRIAADLHDLVSHGLGLITVRAAAARSVTGPAGETERAAALSDIERASRETTTELRRMLGVLRTPGNAPLRPAETLSDLPAIVAAAGTRATLTVDDVGEVSPGVQLTVCAVVREALANTARHAGRAKADVTVRREATTIVVDVRDTGPVGGLASAPRRRPRSSRPAGARGHPVRNPVRRPNHRRFPGNGPYSGHGRGEEHVTPSRSPRTPAAHRPAGVVAGPAGKPGVAASPAGEPGGEVIRVLIADDQPLLRRSLAILVDGGPGMTTVGQAGTGPETVRLARDLSPDVILMDIRMPGGDGIAATRAVSADPALAGTRVLVLSMYELDEYVYGALRAGASGFLLKDAHPEDLIEAVRRTHAGESLFAPAILTRLVDHYVNRPAGTVPAAGPKVLTARETEVLTLIARGLSNAEIVDALGISIKTVKTHVGSLLAKLHARDRAQLVIVAYATGLTGPAGRRSLPSGP